MDQSTPRAQRTCIGVYLTRLSLLSLSHTSLRRKDISPFCLFLLHIKNTFTYPHLCLRYLAWRNFTVKMSQGKMQEGKLLHSPSIVIGRVQARVSLKSIPSKLSKPSKPLVYFLIKNLKSKPTFFHQNCPTKK